MRRWDRDLHPRDQWPAQTLEQARPCGNSWQCSWPVCKTHRWVASNEDKQEWPYFVLHKISDRSELYSSFFFPSKNRKLLWPSLYHAWQSVSYIIHPFIIGKIIPLCITLGHWRWYLYDDDAMIHFYILLSTHCKRQKKGQNLGSRCCWHVHWPSLRYILYRDFALICPNYALHLFTFLFLFFFRPIFARSFVLSLS